MSMRSCGSLSSPTAHMTFCTLMEFLRPQIFSMMPPVRSSRIESARRASRAVCSTSRRREREDAEFVAAWSLQRACLFGEHDRNAVADRIGELGGARDQLLSLGVVFERALGERADEDFEQFGIDAAGGPV